MKRIASQLFKSEDKTFWRIEDGELIRDDTLTFEAQVEEQIKQRGDSNEHQKDSIS